VPPGGYDIGVVPPAGADMGELLTGG
jgi:hypothetical protein